MHVHQALCAALCPSQIRERDRGGVYLSEGRHDTKSDDRQTGFDDLG